MTEIEIKQLQTEKRFSDDNLKILWFIVYLPVGLVIAILRILLAIVAWILCAVLPDVPFTKNLLKKICSAIFGVVVQVENVIVKKNVKVLISNQVSPLDHFVVHYITDCVTPCTSSSSPQLLYSLGLKIFGSSTNLDEVKKSIGSHITNEITPVLFQPEFKVTNGKALLKFKDWPFSFTDEVQPVHLKIRRPILDISITTLDSSYWHDIFWYLFSPWTIYDLYFLPVVQRNGLNDSEFGEKVREEFAKELMVELSSYSSSDVNDWEKRYLAEKLRARIIQNAATQSNNPELHRMTRQVKEVLPTVPYNVIFKEVARTRSVDVAISNILEGHVTYTPEAISTAPSPVSQSATSISVTPGPSSAPSSRDMFNTAASSFPKSAQERMQSFQERKLQLIATARLRYIEKHGLDIKDSNINC